MLQLFVSASMACISSFFLKAEIFYLMIPVGVVSLLYAGRFIHPGLAGLREIPFSKAFIVSITWILVTVGLPIIYSDHGFDLNLVFFVIGRFLFILALAVLFDYRDRSIDDQSMRTMPQIFGKMGSLWLVSIMVTCSVIFEIWSGIVTVYSTLPVGLCALVLTFLAPNNKSDFFYSFYVDGLLLLPALFLFAQIIISG